MDISKTNSGIHPMLSNIYNANNQPNNAINKTADSQNNLNGIDGVNTKDKSNHSLQFVNVEKHTQDRFSPSQEMKKAQEIGGDLQGGFRDKTSFERLSDTLKNNKLINSNEKVAMDYLKNNSSKLSFDEFDKIAANDNHTKEMKGLLDSVIHKMKFVDNVNGGGIL